MSRKSRALPPSPFRRFNSSPVVIRLVSRKKYEWKYEWKNRNSLQIATIQIIPGNESSCSVQWQFEQHLHWYPWEKFGSLMNDKIIGAALEASLENLKKLSEKIN